MFLPILQKGPPPRAMLMEALGEEGRARARAVLSTFPGYAPTPLHSLAGLAGETGVAAIHVKDEARRFGLSSFKSLGGAYAVVSLVLEGAAKRLCRKVRPEEIAKPEIRSIASDMTFCCATDGVLPRAARPGR